MHLINFRGQQYECDDYRELIRPFVPEFLNLIEENSKEDREIQQKFLERGVAVLEAVEQIGIFRAETTFFDELFNALENDSRAIALLEFINNCISVIKEAGHGKKIRKTIKDMVVNFDISESRFYSRVGELAGWRKILMNRDFLMIDMVEIDKLLPNGKDVDVAFRFKSEDCFCDFLSIDFNVGKLESGEDLIKFLEGRIAKKFQDKYQDLDRLYLKNAAIVPIIWCSDLRCFKPHKVQLDQFIASYKNQIFPPYGLVYIKKNNKYYFETISSFFDLMTE